MTDYTLHLTEKQTAEISRACEILARLRMGQIDMALRELPLDKPMGYEQERYISNYLRSLYQQDGRQLHQVSWDLHQVIRHRLAWDRAYAEGTVKPGERRKWPEMMGVMYDEPLRVSDEPLALIHISDHEKLQAENAQLRAAIRRLCNMYEVDDYYMGQLREERLEDAVNRAINAAIDAAIEI